MTIQAAQKIPKGWKETTLGEVADVETGKNIPTAGQLSSGTYEIVGANGVIGFTNSFLLDGEYILTGRVGTIGEISYKAGKFYPSDNVLYVQANNKNNNRFIYYLLKILNIKTLNVGSTQPLVKQSDLRNLSLCLPPLPEQSAIAAVLLSLDNKIELLREQNITLEATAQVIFKEWFISKSEKLPKGWKIGKLNDVTKIVGGTTPSTKNANFWNGDIYWTSPKDLSNSKDLFLLDTEKMITAEGLAQIGSGLLPEGTLILSSRAPIGYLAITNIKTAINQGYIALLPDSYFSNHFMYLWLKQNVQKVISSANGSTFLEISKGSFREISCIIPDKKVLDKFEILIKPLFDKVLINLLQIQNLSKLRNITLPKLMKGQVRVKSYD